MAPLEGKIRQLWPLLLAQGVIVMLLGMVALIMPSLVGMAIAVLLGMLLIASALSDAIVTLTLPHRPGFWWWLVSDALNLMVGGLLFTWPSGGLVSLSLALASFLVLDGGVAIMLSLTHRRARKAKWTWLWINGVLDILLAGLILAVLPQSPGWALGLIVGADLLFAGATLVAMALDERNTRPALARAT